MKAKKLFFKECHLAGRQYHDVDEVWDELHVGTQLELQRDLDNRHDKNAVAVIYRTVDVDTGIVEEYLLGYIQAHYENQIRLTIRIVKNEKE